MTDVKSTVTKSKKISGKTSSKSVKNTFTNSVKGKEKKSMSVSRSYVVFSIIAMLAEAVVILVLMIALTTINNGPKYTVNDKGEVVKVRQDKPVKNGRIVGTDHVIGKKDSEVVFIWYVDMQCPACAQMAPIVNALYQEYGDRVAFVTRYLVITGHDYARPASLAVEAAARQGYYWPMMMSLLMQRSEWAFVNSNELLESRIVKIFEDVTGGAGDNGRFLSDWHDGSLASKIDADERLVASDGFNATPTVVIDGMEIDFVGSEVSTIELFANAIEDALGE